VEPHYREGMWATNCKAIETGLPKPFGTQIMPSGSLPDMEVQDLVFAYLGFSLALFLPLFLCPYASLLEREYLLYAIVSWKYIILFFIFIGTHG
jgi:hypothetical protein